MLPMTRNVDKEQRDAADSSRVDDISKEDFQAQDEGFEGFKGFDTGFQVESPPPLRNIESSDDDTPGSPTVADADASLHAPAKAETAEDDISGSTTFQVRNGEADTDAPSQDAPENAESSFHDRLEADTQVTTTSEGHLTSMTGISDIKKKIPGLPDLILPMTPASPCDERDTDSASSSDGDIDEACSPVIQPLLRRISISGHGRLKTRLQDPPPLTPAMKNQLTHCSSSLLHRRASALAVNEQQNMRLDDMSGSEIPSEGNQANTINPISNASGSFNKNSSAASPPVPEEEHDDDDIILASKKKKTQESKWDIYLQWIILLLLIAFLACLIKIKLLYRATFLGLELWRWVALTLVVFCGRLISGWIVKLLEMLIEKHYILKKRVLYFVYGLRRSVKNCVWLALVLGVWESIFRGLEDTTAVNILTKVLWCLFTASLSWMLKVLAVKVAANSFHRKAYFDRIQECIFNQYLLEVLSGPPTMAGIADTGSGQDRFRKQMTRAERRKQKSNSLNSRESQKPGGAQAPKFQKNPVPHMQRSRRLSRQISIETPGYTTVEVGELPATSVSETHTPNRQKISITSQVPLIARSPIPIEQEKLQELTSDTVSVWTMRRLMKLIRNTNISTYSSIISQEKEEKEISSEVQAKAAAKQVLALTLFIIFFLIFGVETSKLLVFFSSVFLPSVFVFGNSARTTFESLIFLFVTHPFDVGDRIVVDGQSMLVEEMNVLNTIFLGSSNEKVYFPNSLLSVKAISNYYRSPDQGDAIEFQIHMSTPVEKLGVLKERMQRYIESLPQFWYPDFRIVCDKIQDSNKMNMNIWMRHRLNFQDGGERYQRRSNMLLYLKQQLEDLEISYQLPGQEITVRGYPLVSPPTLF